MFLRRALILAPRRAMSSKTSGTPTTTTTTTTSSPTSKKDDSVVTNDGDHHDDGEVSASTSGQTRINYNKDGVGFKADKHTRDTFFNPLLTPPPRSPRSPDDFRNPARLGHWRPLGFDWFDPVKDRFKFHETILFFFGGGILCAWFYSYAPDFKEREWSQREAFLRITKREALGLPLIDPNVVDPDRIVLPTEEELAIYDLPISQ